MEARVKILCLLLLLCSLLYAQRRNAAIAPPADPDEYILPLPPTIVERTPEVSFKVRNNTNSTSVRRRSNHSVGKTRGIDISHYQGNINWQNVAYDDHASYVYIKATESSSLVDKMYSHNVRGARAAGIPVGTYHFFSPSTSATTQLLNLTSTMPDLRNQDLVPMIDVETRGKCSIGEFRERLRQFLVGVERKYGVKPIIYTGTNFYNKYLCGYFDDYLYMIAKYSDEVPNLHGNPRIAMWQYSSSGRVSGIHGNVDLSVFVDNYDLSDIMIKNRK